MRNNAVKLKTVDHRWLAEFQAIETTLQKISKANH
jgi:hypothetical protein